MTPATEEAARAQVYALLAELYFSPPGAMRLAGLRAASAPEGGALAAPWIAVLDAARARADDAIAEEYDALFGGVGEPAVALHGSRHIAGFLNERPLARLRDDLAALGIGRAERVVETEDHIAFLCEVMRELIEREIPLDAQAAFFHTHLGSWAGALCEAIARRPEARFYGCVAQFTRAFVAMEAAAFDLPE